MISKCGGAQAKGKSGKRFGRREGVEEREGRENAEDIPPLQWLHVEQEVHDVTVLHNIFLTLNIHLSGLTHSGF